MKYTRKAWDIVGYTFNADVYHGECLPLTGPGSESVEDVLDQLARDRGIDRYDERSYDSGDFPKVILDSMIEGPEYCGECWEEL